MVWDSSHVTVQTFIFSIASLVLLPRVAILVGLWQLGGLRARNSQQSSREMEPTSISLIPGDIMQQVFGRLPFPELVRLRVVCKKWNAMICSLYLTPPYNFSKCVPVHFLNDELTVYNSRLERWEKHSLAFFQDHIQTSHLEFVASAGGLLCFETDTFGQLIVCNPISKLWKVLQIPSKFGDEEVLPAPKCRASTVRRDFSGAEIVQMRKRKTITGLLVDSATGNYQIIVAALHVDGLRGRATFLYDSLAGSWKKGSQVPEGEEFSDGDAILCNGSLYCLVMTETLNGELFRYDVKKDKWSKLSLDMSVMRCKLVEHRGQVLLVKRNSYYSDESTLRFFQLREKYLSMTLEETDLIDSLNLDAVSVGEVLGHLKSTGRGSVMGQKNFLYVLKPPYEDGLRKKRTRVTIIDLSTGSCDVLREMIVASTDASTAPRKTLIKNVFHLFSASVTVQV